MATHGQNVSTPQTEEEDTDLLTESQKDLTGNVFASEQDNQMAQIFLALGLIPVEKWAQGRIEIRDAFTTLNDPKLAENLLDFNDPTKYQTVRNAHKVTGRLINEKGKYHMDAQGIRRRTYALVIARRLHRKINSGDEQIRFRNTIAVYGLNLTSESTLQFKAQVANWLKDNPGRTLDDALTVVGRIFHIKQNNLEETSLTQEQKQEINNKKNSLLERNKSARKEAIEAEKEILDRAKVVVNQTLDPNRPVQTITQLRDDIKYIETGATTTPTQKWSAPTTTIPSSFSGTTAFPIPTWETTDTATISTQEPQTTISSSQKSQAVPQSQKPTTIPSHPPTKAQQAPSATPKIPKTYLRPSVSFSAPQRFSSFMGGLGKFTSFGNIFKTGLTKIGGNFLKSAMSKLAIKAGLSALGAGLTAGASLVIQGGWEMLKRIPVIGEYLQSGLRAAIDYGKGLAILIIGVPIALIIFALMNQNANTLPYYGAGNAKTIQGSIPTKQSLSWQEFEEIYLVNNEWKQFAKENLIPQKTYLSSGENK